MKKLTDLVDKQRDEIRAKDHELASRNGELEAVRTETNKLHKSDIPFGLFRMTFCHCSSRCSRLA